jgi:glutamate/tyrosine decarboxylase-like PLP-dependent enzyme
MKPAYKTDYAHTDDTIPTGIRDRMFLEMRKKEIFHQAKEYAYEYVDSSWDRNIFPKQEAIDNLKIFDEDLPEFSSEAADVVEQLHRYGSPATVLQTGGRYFGFVTGGVIPTALAARWLSDFWDQNTALQVISPIASKLESVVEKWLKQLFNLPNDTVAGFVSGSSMATLCGLAAARYRITQNK